MHYLCASSLQKTSYYYFWIWPSVRCGLGLTNWVIFTFTTAAANAIAFLSSQGQNSFELTGFLPSTSMHASLLQSLEFLCQGGFDKSSNFQSWTWETTWDTDHWSIPVLLEGAGDALLLCFGCPTSPKLSLPYFHTLPTSFVSYIQLNHSWNKITYLGPVEVSWVVLLRSAQSWIPL